MISSHPNVYETKEEILPLVWTVSNRLIREILDTLQDVDPDPIRPHPYESLGLHEGQIDQHFVPRTEDELRQRLGQIWNGEFRFDYRIFEPEVPIANRLSVVNDDMYGA